MKIKTKTTLIFTLFIILTTVSITTIVVYDIKAISKRNIIQYEKEELAAVKQELKNIVDIAYCSVSQNYKDARNENYIRKFYGHRLRNILDIAFSILSEENKSVQNKQKSIKEAKLEAIKLLKNVRYNNSGYIWINSTDWPYPKMIMHPAKPELDGTILDSEKYNCTLESNQNLFQAGVEKAVKHGDGFINYKWDKPITNGFIPSVQKLSYVRLFKPWNWILGVGVYVDQVIEDAKENSELNIENMRYNNGAGYLFIIDDKTNGVMHPYKKELENKNLAEITDPDGIKLFSEMVKVCKKNKSGIVKYRWPKPLKDGTEIPRAGKMTYVRYFEPWNWIIGSGVYIDQIEQKMFLKETAMKAQINNLISKIITGVFIIVVIAVILSFIFASRMSKPILLLIKKLKEIKLSDLQDSQIELKGSCEIRELGTIFNETTKKLSEAIHDLKETTNAKERIEGELNAARDIQMNIVPNLFPAFPNVSEFELYASINSAKAVGGDLYDFFMIDERKLCFAIGDVSGKGVPASLFMAITHTLLRAKTSTNFQAHNIVQEMNTILCKDNDSCMFVTFFLGILDIKTGVIEYSNAGHNLPFIIKGQDNVEEFTDCHGPALGVMEDAKYGMSKITLSHGDTIFLYTDGVTEATDIKDEMFETERLIQSLEKTKLLSPKGIIDSITKDLMNFVGAAEQADDITMLTLTYRG